MKNKEQWFNVIEEMKTDSIRKQKNGLHFIVISIVIWFVIMMVHLSGLPLEVKNVITFCCSIPLVPGALVMAKILKVDFQNKENPLTKLGMILALNQMIYMLIAMWIFYMIPEYLVMVYAIIVGAHFLPYGWLYRSKIYTSFSIVMPVVCFLLGMRFTPWMVAAAFVIMEVVLCAGLLLELRKNTAQK